MVKPLRLLPLLAALALCGCQSVQSTKPVGDKVADLKPAIWNAKWQDGTGGILRSEIKDSRLGIVELTPIAPKPKPDEPKNYELLVRTLGDYTIIDTNFGNPKGPYDFVRVAIVSDRIVVFAPNTSTFVTLIKQHRIAGRLDRDKHGKPTGCLLKSFSERDFLRLKKEGFETRTLFDEDPYAVHVRYSWKQFWGL
ncbi:MAG: hypothetical protein WCD79_00435 [Chthoniobacteraceae bacterium]